VQVFTPDEARQVAAVVVELGDELVEVRAELTEHRAGAAEGALAELKGLEARLADLLDRIVELGVQLKGWAPLLVDIPVEHDGRVVLLCLLEGDRQLGWYHEPEHGFAGRRPIADLGLEGF
jgi:hypothetical protein